MGLNIAAEVFFAPAMSQTSRATTAADSLALAQVQIQLLTTSKTKARARRLLARHHSLGDVRAVGQQLFYAITDARGDWLGGLVFCAASRRLRARDQWIGWTEEPRRRRLPLVVNHGRFLLLPHKSFPNLGSRSLRLTLDRLSADWQERYGHPVVLVETFVDPEQLRFTPPMAGRNWARPTALAACAATSTSSATNPNASSPVNCARTPAAVWLADNRAAWGIESGLHQRLDVSHRDDLCRVRRPKAMRLMGRFRRIRHSLFLEWRSRQNKPRHKTTTDFFSAMNAEHHRYALRCLRARQPSFQTAS